MSSTLTNGRSLFSLAPEDWPLKKNKARKSELCMCVCVQERINIIFSAARNIMLKYHAVNAVKENMVNPMNYNKSKHKSMVTIKAFPPILQ